MLTLLLFRHAKAEPGSASQTDDKRPLAPKGRAAADEMGRRLAVEGIIPDLVLCSPATRTLETLALASTHWAPAPRTSIDERLYRQMGSNYVELVRASPPTRRLMLVGHNSATETTARSLVGRGDRQALSGLASGFPTAAIAVIEFDASGWSDVAAGQGTLVTLLTPA